MSVQDKLYGDKVGAGAGVINCAGTIGTVSLKLRELVGKFVGEPK